ncbi:ADP-ribosyl-[dinitrogen reductase] glycohydrolase-like [Haliotis cracherodii]|uniref:ADP-ribosyl-[dinitrogen reductase] glycohydrolase-like n=1 Tax=Haliotis cracherodii TaxID=6455 RepID=UPI0039E9D350
MAEAASTPGATAGYPRDQILATLYGQAVGDAIGLLTEFLTKEEAKEEYGEVRKQLELEHKHLWPDVHRTRWEEGDWTDDTDQMILILQSLIDNDGQVKPEDFAERLKFWSRNGFPELGDRVGMGIGTTTAKVIANPEFVTEPHKAAREWWESGKMAASNGAVMRTCILGVQQFWDTEAVAHNALDICRTTHYDPRCQASTVAVSVAISLMLMRAPQHLKRSGKYRVNKIIQDSFQKAAACLETQEQKKELKSFLEMKNIRNLRLSESGKIGYTYKCLGAGFWALKQKDFRKALQKIVMEGGDADTNGAVAGALLGCKLGMSALPASWVANLKHKAWLDDKIEKYFVLSEKMMAKK